MCVCQVKCELTEDWLSDCANVRVNDSDDWTSVKSASVMNGWTNEWMNEWVTDSMNEWMIEKNPKVHVQQ